ncbi:MAG: 4-hydroxy-tetrahydrodipicolinate synthase [Clostridia bacterium]|nr:4-hydroxy-tetrahydrodipicolinate synthase [Clostridia bacterium]
MKEAASKMKDFGRVITAMVTPFKRDQQQSVNYQAAQELAAYLVEHGSDGIVVSGTTGESPTLSAQEKLDLIKAVKEAVGQRAKIIAGTGSNSTSASIELTKKVEALDVDAVLLVVPYYNRPSQEGLYQHFASIARNTSLPCIIYNVPSRTGRNLEPKTLVRLAEVDNIVAVKEASGDLNQATELASLLPEDFLIYSGDDALTLPILSVGGYGVISVASHVAGVQIQKVISSYVSGRVKQAAQINSQLFPLYKVIFINTNPIPIKAAVNLIGIDVGIPRLPLVEASPQEIASIREVMVRLGLIS